MANLNVQRIVVQTDGRAVTPTTVNAWIECWLRHTGVSRRPGALAHAFRHATADGWLDTGATLAEVQALLGHASVATTGIYTKAGPTSLIEVTNAGRYEPATPVGVLGGRKRTHKA